MVPQEWCRTQLFHPKFRILGITFIYQIPGWTRWACCQWPQSTVFFFFNFYCYSITVVCLFSPSVHLTPDEPTSLPWFYPPPSFCACVLYSNSCNALSPLSPTHSPLVIVRFFLTSMSLVIFCLLFSCVDYVPIKGEIIWYLSLTAWLISRSIMLSSSIHAVAKGISSFFLSAA